jgi:spermidine/putrescine transport system substrate-binding protein
MKEGFKLNRWMSMLALLLVLLVAACAGGQPAEAPAPQTTDEEATPAEEAAEEAAEDAGDEAAEESAAEESAEEAAEDAGDEAAATQLEVDRSQLSEELYLFNWSEYLDPALLDAFEEEYGVRVIEDFYDANESMLPKIRAGNSGYDIVVPSDYAVEILREEDLLAPLDKSLLPNLEYINPALLDLYYDPGNAYSVPYFWGTTGLAYNTEYFEEPPTSWSVLFEQESLEELSGRFTMLEDPRETPAAALAYLGHSINTTDEAELQEAKELLLFQKPYVAAYDSSNANLKLATEEIVIAHTYDGSAATARLGIEDKPGNPNIAYTIPQEGGVIWQDNMAIVAESPNQYTAHVFINFLMRPDIAAQNADYVLYLTPNEGAEPLLAEETQEIFDAISPDEDIMDQMQWIQRSEETDVLYNELWTEVVSQ